MTYPKIALREEDADSQRIREWVNNDIVAWTEEEIREDPDCTLDDGQTVVVYEPVYKLTLAVTKKLEKTALKEKK